MLGLENLFCWVPWIIRWCLSWLVTRGRIQTHERGVKICGNKIRELEPGTYWYFHRWSECFIDNIKRKVIELDDQLLTTKDGKRVRVGGVLIYHITNIVTWLVENEHAEEGLVVDAARVLRDLVVASTFADLQEPTARLRKDDEMTKRAQADLGSDFGVRIRHLGLTIFAESDALALHHSGITIGSSAEEEEEE